MVGRPLRPAAAADVLRIPVDDLIEQAHAALVRNVFFDPGAVHSAWFDLKLPACDTSRYSRTAVPPARKASRRNKGKRARRRNRRSQCLQLPDRRIDRRSSRRASISILANEAARLRGVSTSATPKASGIGRLSCSGCGYSRVVRDQQNRGLIDRDLGHRLQQARAKARVERAQHVRFGHGAGGDAPITRGRVVHRIGEASR